MHAPLRIQILSFYHTKFSKRNRLRSPRPPPTRSTSPPYGKSWVRHCILNAIYIENHLMHICQFNFSSTNQPSKHTGVTFHFQVKVKTVILVFFEIPNVIYLNLAYVVPGCARLLKRYSLTLRGVSIL